MERKISWRSLRGRETRLEREERLGQLPAIRDFSKMQSKDMVLFLVNLAVLWIMWFCLPTYLSDN